MRDSIQAALNSPEFHCSFATALPKRPTPSSSRFFGSGRYATGEDASAYLELDSRDVDGIWLSNVYPMVADERGKLVQKHGLFLSKKVRPTGLFLGGATGSGKTEIVNVIVFESVEQNSHHSHFIVETTGILADRIRAGYPDVRVIVLNASNPWRCQRRWNVFHEADATKLYRKVVSFCQGAETQGGNDSKWFFHFAVSVIMAVILCLRADGKYADLRGISEVINWPRRRFQEYLKAHCNVPYVNNILEFDGCSGSSNFETGMYSTVLMLATLMDDSIAAFTCGAPDEQLDFRRDLFDRPTVVVVELAQEEIEKLRPILSCLISDLLQAVPEAAKQYPGNKLPRQLNVTIDEAATVVGCLPTLPLALNTLRKYGVAFTIVSPSLTAFRQCYGRQAEAVLDGLNSVILLSPTSVEDAEWASKQSGTMTADLEAFVADGSDNDTITFRRSVTPTARPVLTPEDVRFGDQRHPTLGGVITFFMRGCPVFQGWAQPGYAISKYDPFTKASVQAGVPLREKPLRWISPFTEIAVRPRFAPRADPLPPGVSDTRGWSDAQLAERLDAVRAQVDWDNTVGSAREWWLAFEKMNMNRMAVVLRLAEELLSRKATITEFFLSFVYGNTDNIQAVLYFLDYTRLKQEEEKKKKELAVKLTAEQISDDEKG